jgi:hypothetical protein
MHSYFDIPLLSFMREDCTVWGFYPASRAQLDCLTSNRIDAVVNLVEPVADKRSISASICCNCGLIALDLEYIHILIDRSHQHPIELKQIDWSKTEATCADRSRSTPTNQHSSIDIDKA